MAQLILKSQEQIANEIGVEVKYVTAAYQYRNGPWNTTWVPGPEVHRVFDKVSYGSYQMYTEVNGERIWRGGSHITDLQYESIEKAVNAVKDYENVRHSALMALWDEGYDVLLSALLEEDQIDMTALGVKLFHNRGGQLNTGNGISVSPVEDWKEANAAVFYQADGTIVATFNGKDRNTAFYSGFGTGNQGTVRQWRIGNSIADDIRRAPGYS